MSRTRIDIKHIAEKAGVKPKHACDYVVKRADFPKPCLVLSIKTRRWWEDEVDAWFEQQEYIAQRGAERVRRRSRKTS